MAVDGLQRVTVVHHDAVSVDPQVRRPHHAPVVGRVHRRILDIREIETQVYLPVHLLAVIDVVAHVGEIGLFLAVVQEGTVPQHLLLGLEAQIGKLLVVPAAEVAIDFEEAREQVGAGRQGAAGIHGVDQRGHQAIGQRKLARPEFLRLHAEPEPRGDLGAGQVAREDQRHGARFHVPGVPEHGEPLACATARERKTAKRVRPHAHSGLRHRPQRRQRHQFHAALVDVVLQAVGAHPRRRQHHGHVAERAVRQTAEVVRDGLHHHPRLAFLQLRHFALADLERHATRRYVPLPEETRRRRALREHQRARAVLLHVCRQAAHPVRIGNPDRDRRGCAGHRHRRAEGQRGAVRKESQRGGGQNQAHENGGGDSHFFTQKSSQSSTVEYHRRLFCGFRTQWPSSGKISSLAGTS